MSTETAAPARDDIPARAVLRRSNWFGAFWRWHFYGSLIVIPVLLTLAVTGLIYLFRAQVDAVMHPGVLQVEVPAGQERLPLSAQEEAVVTEFPEWTVLSVQDSLAGRATVFHMDAAGESRNVYVDPYSAEITGDLAPSDLLSDWAVTTHGTLMSGTWGERIIELGACWAIVLAITGFILFFKGRAARAKARRARTRGARTRWMHAWVGAGLGVGILFLVVSGLPWTSVWGSKAQELATKGETSLWSDDHGAESTLGEQIEASHGSSASAGWTIAEAETAESAAAVGTSVSVDTATAAARAEGALEPYLVMYPADETGVYSVMATMWYNAGNPSENDPSLEKVVHVDQYSGEVAATYGYDDYSLAAKAVAQGIAGHEGRRFGELNTVITTAFCLGIIFMCVSGPVMWWKRRGYARGTTGAPKAKLPVLTNWVTALIVVALGLFLPLFGLSVIALLLIDQLLIRRVPALKRFFASAD
ncbi:PepSY domain-containing protein [Demequina sp. NBRC 110053]|uniref:PepSY-associated TM helix domain-containing protein n=1 Tax=Demequina sp. NBRC 110053 TaxID=1570342 RepID=UPI000A04C5D3|nr:PepSY domain-containing protein [Demequina sp. NBRC 110053]